MVTANLLLLHNVARAHGGEGRILAANRDIEPETLGLALDVVSEGILTHLTFQDRRLPTALAILWDRIDDGAARRRRRLDRQ